jgi:hypothetical protein
VEIELGKHPSGAAGPSLDRVPLLAVAVPSGVLLAASLSAAAGELALGLLAAVVVVGWSQLPGL